ncbi:MAG: formylmethanofuran dehydrogenase subunit E [Chloroflexota bacterium]|nr:TraR/DksA C4-type zinc finger protein [Caldilinea sp.]GIK71918.1 MAG: formylmethanofuran dehydrogenase subunit E [Chloroflexota bacterium]
MKTLYELLAESAALHRHLCPRQVLGVQMARLAAQLLSLDLPQRDKRLLTIVETDGCFTSGLSVATNCWVGRRTLRIEDYGKVAATFVDTRTERAIRIAPSPTARERASAFAPDATNRWEAMLIGYQRMTPTDIFVWQPVILMTPVKAIISRAGHRALCVRCGEEILNEREVVIGDATFCRHCAYGGYYLLCDEGVDQGLPVAQWALQAAD